MVGRPSQALITRERIFHAALRIVDDHGADALSINRLAVRLGVKGSSLYHHIAGKAEIIDGLRELLIAEMDATAGNLRPWTAALERWARSYRAVFAAHPRVIPLVTASPIQSPAVVRAYEKAFVILREAGWPEGDLMPVVRAVEYFIVGSVLDLVTPSAEQAEYTFDVGLSALLAGLRARLDERFGTATPAGS